MKKSRKILGISLFGLALISLGLILKNSDVAKAQNSFSRISYTGVNNAIETVYNINFSGMNLMEVTGGNENIFRVSKIPVIINAYNHGGLRNAIVGDEHSHILGGDNVKINSSSNVTVIGGEGSIGANNPNTTFFGGYLNRIDSNLFPSVVSTVLLGGQNNLIETGHESNAIVGGSDNRIKQDAENVNILGGNRIVVSGSNVIAGGQGITGYMQDSFAFNDGTTGVNLNTDGMFYLGVANGVGLGTGVQISNPGVFSNGAVDLGNIDINVINCVPGSNNVGLMGSWNGCLVGCTSGSELLNAWELLDHGNNCASMCDTSDKCIQAEVEEWSNDYDSFCTVGLVDTGNAHMCYTGGRNSYDNVIFQTYLIDAADVVACPTNPINQCVYQCNEHAHLTGDKTGFFPGITMCFKDCALPWDPNTYIRHNAIVTGYSVSSVECSNGSGFHDTCTGSRSDGLPYKSHLMCVESKWYVVTNGVVTNTVNTQYIYGTCTQNPYRCAVTPGAYDLDRSNVMNAKEDFIPSVWKYTNNSSYLTTFLGGTIIPGELFYYSNITTWKSDNPTQYEKQTQIGVRGRYELCIDYDPLYPNNQAPNNEKVCTEKTPLPTQYHYKFIGCNTGNGYHLAADGVCRKECTYSGFTVRHLSGIIFFTGNRATCPDICHSGSFTCFDGTFYLNLVTGANGQFISGTPHKYTPYAQTGCILTGFVCSGYYDIDTGGYLAAVNSGTFSLCTNYAWADRLYNCTTLHNMYHLDACTYDYYKSGSQCIHCPVPNPPENINNYSINYHTFAPGYNSLTSGATLLTQCLIVCTGGNHVAAQNGRCVACLTGQSTVQHVVSGGRLSLCSECKNKPTQGSHYISNGSGNQTGCNWLCNTGRYQSGNYVKCNQCPTSKYYTPGGSGATLISQCVTVCTGSNNVATKNSNCSACAIGYSTVQHIVSGGYTSSQMGKGCLECKNKPAQGSHYTSNGSGYQTGCNWRCNTGRYQSGNYVKCNQCPTAKYYTPGGSGATLLKQCVTVCTGGNNVATKNSNCSACATGYSTVQHVVSGGYTSSQMGKGCLECKNKPAQGSHYISNGSGNQTGCNWQCNLDRYRNGSAVQCIQCNIGSGYHNNGSGYVGQSHCKVGCPNGFHVNTGGLGCVPCPLGSTSTSHTVHQGDTSSCDGCNIPDNAHPIDIYCGWACDTNYYRNSAGTGCVKCPDGYQTTGSGATQKSQCRILSTGSNNVATIDKKPQACAIGLSTKQHVVSGGLTSEDMQQGCRNCLNKRPTTEGSHYTSNGSGYMTGCSWRCNTGRYLSGNAKECKQCYNGYFTPGGSGATHLSQCIVSCPAYKQVTSIGGLCEFCPVGSTTVQHVVSGGYTSSQIRKGCTGCDNAPSIGAEYYVQGTCNWRCIADYYRNGSAIECKACFTSKGYHSSTGSLNQDSCTVTCLTGYHVAVAGSGCQICTGGLTTRKHTVPQGSTSAQKYEGCSFCEDIPDNSHSININCDWECNDDYYKNPAGTGCRPCSPGYHTTTSGAMSRSACIIKCDTGYHVAALGGKCAACPGGETTGDHVVNEGNISYCSKCPANKYKSGNVCVNCPSGYTSPAGSNSKSQCTITCNTGYHVATEDGGCVACAADVTTGTHVVSGGNTSVCKKCPAGKYKTSSGCVLCPHGPEYSYISLEGSYQKSQCRINCQIGTHVAIGDGPCVECGAGESTGNHTVYASNTSSCSKCPANKYKSGNICVDCPSGYSSPEGSNSKSQCHITCNTGTHVATADGECVACSTTHTTGTHVVYASNTSNCSPCPVNKYKSGNICVNCPSGYSSPVGSNSKCQCVITCNVGYHITTPGGSCEACPTGMTAPGKTVTACSQAESCVDDILDCGGITPSGNGVEMGASQYINGSTTTTSWTYNTTTNGTLGACQWRCPANKYKSGNTCVNCPSGYTSPEGSNSKSQCTITCYSGDHVASEDGKCEACADVRYTTVTHVVSGGYTSNCSPCPANQYKDENNNCVSCPSGYSSPIGSTSKTQCKLFCATGTHIAVVDGPCVACAAGMTLPAYTGSAGSTTGCVNDAIDCEGTKPSGNGVAMGSSQYENGATTTSWTYKGKGTLGACEWRCADGYIARSYNNSCEVWPCGTYNPSDFHDLDMYFITDAGAQGHYTLMDRNLGATQVYNGTQNVCTYGYNYQWGNNYGFIPKGLVDYKTNLVDVSGYGPGNYFSSGTFIKNASYWSSGPVDVFNNLWGDSGSEIDRQGPCPNGYHLPLSGELFDIMENYWKKSVDYTGASHWALDSLMPFAGYRSFVDVEYNDNGYAHYWTASHEISRYAVGLIMYASTNKYGIGAYPSTDGRTLRCFKNSSTPSMTIHPNGGVKVMITVHNGVITKLGTPTKGTDIFGGWYSDSSFNSRVYTGDTAPTHLYAKWLTLQCNGVSSSNGEITICNPYDDTECLTMMDRNLGASEAGFGGGVSNPSYGDYYQWGHNCLNFDTISSNLAIWNNAYNNSGYCGSDVYLSLGSDYWADGGDHNNLRGGGNDSESNGYGYPVNNPNSRKGPCPQSYHVPSRGEWEKIIEWWGVCHPSFTGVNTRNATNGGVIAEFLEAFLIPRAGHRASYNSYGGVGQDSELWTSTPVVGGNYSYHFFAGTGTFNTYTDVHYTYKRGGGLPIRCFKNAGSDDLFCGGTTPSGIGVVTGASQYVNGATTTSWTYKASGTLGACQWRCADGYTQGANNTCVVGQQTVVSDLEMYFLTDAGVTGYFVMMDRNLGATAYMNELGKTTGEWYGSYYQWGNNYGFPNQGAVNVSSTRVNVSGYGPSNPYSSDTFILAGNDWSTDHNNNLWGDTSGTVIARRGPCPAGYHVPSSSELIDMDNYWENSANYTPSNMVEQRVGDTLMPFAGARVGSNVESQGTDAHYWSSTPYDNIEQAYTIRFYPSYIIDPEGAQYRESAFSVRCFKNSQTPSLILHPNGGTGAVIVVHGGVITKLGMPTKGDEYFGGWYSDESFTSLVSTGDVAPSHLYALWATVNQCAGTLPSGSGVIVGMPIYPDGYTVTEWTYFGSELADGMPCLWRCADGYTQGNNNTCVSVSSTCNANDMEFQDLDLYFVSNDSQVGHVTLMDRNLGAESAGTGESAYGNYYQRGNNYAFGNGSITTSNSETSCAGYGPSNPFCRSIFYVKKNNNSHADVCFSTSSSIKNNLWGNTTNTSIARRGPCPSGYHIPSKAEWKNLLDLWIAGHGVSYSPNQLESKYISNSAAVTLFQNDLLIPKAGSRDWEDGGSLHTGGSAYLHTTTPYQGSSTDTSASKFHLSNYIAIPSTSRSYGVPIRCFKNSNNSQITLHPNEGKKTDVIVQGGVITKLGTPTKAGLNFGGWYSDNTLIHQVQVGDTAPSDLYARWVTTSCSSGSYLQGTTCTSCPANTYTNGEGATQLSDCLSISGYYLSGSTVVQCPSNYYTNGPGATQLSDCKIDCQAGKYVNAQKGSCVSCPSTKTSNAHSVSGGNVSPSGTCFVCSANKYKSGNVCVDCPSSYTSSAGSTKLADCKITCQAGKYVATQKGQCESCPSGKTSNAHSVSGGNISPSGTCFVGSCPANQYKSGNTCVDCPSSYTSSAGSTQLSDCKITCQAGTYVTTQKKPCVSCPSGQTSNEHTVNGGSTSPSGTCYEIPIGSCPANQYKSGNTCVDCPSSYTSSAGSTQLSDCKITCQAGKYVSTQKGQCVSCPSGKTSNEHTVNGGSTSPSGTCFSCPDDQYLNGTVCTPCTYPNNSEHPINNGGVCGWQCIANYYQDGNNTCAKCNSNSSNTPYTSNAGAQSHSNCRLTCSSRQYVATAGGSCVACSEGYGHAAYTYNRGEYDTCCECTNKPSDTVIVNGKKVEIANYTSNGYDCASCDWDCIAGYYKDGKKCTKCPDGYPNSNTGATKVDQCYAVVPAGCYKRDKSTTTLCTPCSTGYYSDEHTVAYLNVSPDKTCKPCKNLNDSNAVYTSNGTNQYNCATGCIANYYFDLSKYMCLSCPDTYYSETGAIGENACKVDCPAGTHVASPYGGSKCEPCDVGTATGAHSLYNGSISYCVNCNKPSNSTFTGNGTGGPNSCPWVCNAGFYKDISSNTCVSCGKGKTSLTGAVKPSDCFTGAKCGTANGKYFVGNSSALSGGNPNLCGEGILSGFARFASGGISNYGWRWTCNIVKTGHISPIVLDSVQCEAYRTQEYTSCAGTSSSSNAQKGSTTYTGLSQREWTYVSQNLTFVPNQVNKPYAGGHLVIGSSLGVCEWTCNVGYYKNSSNQCAAAVCLDQVVDSNFLDVMPSPQNNCVALSSLDYACNGAYEFTAGCNCRRILGPYSNGCYACEKGNATCFIAGTKVIMSDGTRKNIEDIEIGEKVMGKDGTTNTVLGFHKPLLGDKELWSINGGEYFVTAEHPFMTTEGWKSLNPELSMQGVDIEVTLLNVGDILITDNGEVEIYSLESKKDKSDTQLYNLLLDGNHTYYANGYLVHNKDNSHGNHCMDDIPANLVEQPIGDDDDSK